MTLSPMLAGHFGGTPSLLCPYRCKTPDWAGVGTSPRLSLAGSIESDLSMDENCPLSGHPVKGLTSPQLGSAATDFRDDARLL